MYFFSILINMKVPVHISLCSNKRAALEGSRRREGAISRGARPNPGAASFLHPISLITSITWSLHLGRHTTIPRSLHLGRSTPRAPQEAPHDSAQGGRTTTKRDTTWGNTTRRNTTQGNAIPHGVLQNREISHGEILKGGYR